VVQDHPDEGTRLGSRADAEAVRWFGQVLGWAWPPSYVDVLSRHDGVVVQDAILLGFVASIERFLPYHRSWYRPGGYWPIASDGCGNYFALALGQRDAAGECPVVFIDTMADAEEPAYTVAASYAGFVRGHMRCQCERFGCSALTGPGTSIGDDAALR
jgi:hypothetical protein